MGRRLAPLLSILAAAAAIVVAATATIVAAAQAVVAAAAEQQDQDDDPPAVVTTETIVTHRYYLQDLLSSDAAHSNIFRRAKMVRSRKRPTDYKSVGLCSYFHNPSGYLPSSAIAFKAATT